jgi:hypothetical protein
MRKLLIGLVGALAMLALPSCNIGTSKNATYTLYRSSVTGPMRMHVASFDADEDGSYNLENCMIARDLFQKQPGVKVVYWCEPGPYKS